MNRQATIQAMRATLHVAHHYDMSSPDGGIPECDLPHLQTMLARVMGDPTMSEGKMGRWLGWMQACVVMGCFRNEVDLVVMKEINFHSKMCGSTVDQAMELGLLGLELSAKQKFGKAKP